MNIRISKKFGNIALMARGATTLFSDILMDENEALAEKQAKGRNEMLIAKRNELLIDRYFFYVKTFNFRYDYILEKLSDEFFLSKVTIPKIMEAPHNQLYLRRLKMEKPEVKMFKQKWPHLVWAA